MDKSKDRNYTSVNSIRNFIKHFDNFSVPEQNRTNKQGMVCIRHKESKMDLRSAN